MTLKLYNTYSRQVEPLVPSNPDGVVRMYCCGPTVYNYAHIGNLRTYIFEDVLRKTIKRAGFPLKHAMNITDVGHLTSDADEGDDKMLAAEKEHKTVMDIARKYEDTFFKHTQALNIDRPDIVCRATEHVQDMIKFVEELERKGYAYFSNGNVYFDTSKFPAYGSLSGQKRDDLKHGARVETDENKRNESDFVLWFTSSKFKNQILQWDTKWGRGYPGWHIECSAMSNKYLGDTFDFHGGGSDLIFPHHENEIAQSEAYTGKKPMVKYWLHNGFITINSEKMSKSLNNFFLVKDVLEHYSPDALRYFLISNHYCSPLDFSDERLEEMTRSLERLGTSIDNVLELLAMPAGAKSDTSAQLLADAKKIEEDFEEAMCDDFNTALASAAMFELARKVNIYKDAVLNKNVPVDSSVVSEVKRIFKTMTDILGILEDRWTGSKGEASNKDYNDLMDLILEVRQECRAQKQYALADAIRDKLAALGITVEDSPQGARWKK